MVIWASTTTTTVSSDSFDPHLNEHTLLFAAVANLFKDTIVDESMDLIIHAGDHCYNEGDDDERRADGYMQAFQQTIANVPWMPVSCHCRFRSADGPCVNALFTSVHV